MLCRQRVLQDNITLSTELIQEIDDCKELLKLMFPALALYESEKKNCRLRVIFKQKGYSKEHDISLCLPPGKIILSELVLNTSMGRLKRFTTKKIMSQSQDLLKFS